MTGFSTSTSFINTLTSMYCLQLPSLLCHLPCVTCQPVDSRLRPHLRLSFAARDILCLSSNAKLTEIGHKDRKMQLSGQPVGSAAGASRTTVHRRPVSLKSCNRWLSITSVSCSSASEADVTSTSGRDSTEDIAAAWSLLNAFNKVQFRGLGQQYVGTAAARAKLRDAFLLAYNNPCAAENWNPGPQPEVMLGVCAGDSRLGLRALRDWCQACNLDYIMPDCRVTGIESLAAVEGAVYIKYNSVSKLCYLSQYKGRERGVLIQLGQGPMLGHFPLGFFDEAMSNPAPPMEAPAAGSSSSS